VDREEWPVFAATCIGNAAEDCVGGYPHEIASNRPVRQIFPTLLNLWACYIDFEKKNKIIQCSKRNRDSKTNSTTSDGG
jgi:hypothetical protein